MPADHPLILTHVIKGAGVAISGHGSMTQSPTQGNLGKIGESQASRPGVGPGPVVKPDVEVVQRYSHKSKAWCLKDTFILDMIYQCTILG